MTVKSRRLELSALLNDIMAIPDRVYYEPGPNITMEYPCIVYERTNMDRKHANNKVYSLYNAYQVTLISYDPDDAIIDKLAALPLCAFDRHFKTSKLNHNVFVIYS